MKSTLLLLAALLALPLSAAHGQAMKGMDMSGAPKGASPSDKAYAASMAKMMKDMETKPTGKPDQDFVLMMLPHHQGAVDMAKVELQYGTDPQLRQLATDIVAAQEKEIAFMQGWLAKAGR